MRLRLLAVVFGALASACSSQVSAPSPTGTAPASGEFRLLIQEGGNGPARLSVVSGLTGAAERQLPLGALTFDGTKLFAIDRRGGRATLRAVDAASGTTTQATTFDAAYDLVPVALTGLPGGLSPNGHWLALGHQDNTRYSGKSRFLVFPTTFDAAPKTVELNGDFRFDALSNDGTRLYLEQFVSGRTGYQVRMYDLILGTLWPGVVSDKTRGTRAMSGERLYAIPTVDGQSLYSLYINGSGGPFIHALNLVQPFAWCISLPGTAKDDPVKQQLWSIAMSRDGRTIYAANSALGTVTRIDMGNPPRIRQSAQFPASAAANATPTRRAGGRAALSPDGKTLFLPADRGIVAVDTASLNPIGTYLPDMSVDGMAFSPDGAWLYAVSPDEGKLVRINATTGATAGPAAGVGATASLLGVAAAS